MKSQSRKPTLLYVITQGHWGGAQMYIYSLITALKDDFDIHIAIGAGEKKNDLAHKLAKIVPIHKLDHLKRAISPIHDTLALLELHKLYKTIQPDIIHLNSTKAGILGSVASAGFKHAKVVYTAHGWVFHEPISKMKKVLYKALEAYSSKYKDTIITLSPQDSRIGKQLAKKHTTITEIPIGIAPAKLLSKKDAQDVLQKKISKKVNNNTFWFGTIANLYKTKGYDVYLHAIAEMKKKNECVFFCIGDGPEKEDLVTLKKELHLKNVYFVGTIESAQTLLNAFDTFVLPSKKEGLPYTILEAMHAKVPVITTNVGGIPSLITHKETGLCVEPSNTKELTKALDYTKDNTEVMNQYAKKAKGVSDNYRIKNMEDRTRDCYRTLLEN